MKLIYFIFPLAFLLSSSLLANQPKTGIRITVPFINVAVNSPEYHQQGLSFDYQLNNGELKVVCTLSNFNNGWLEYQENGVTKQSSTIVNNAQTLILTSKGATQHLSPMLDQYHVDSEGPAAIFNIENLHAPASFATCLYVAEGN